MPESQKPSLPSTLYTKEYFLNACEGYEEFVESQGERLSRRLSEAFAYAADRAPLRRPRPGGRA